MKEVVILTVSDIHGYIFPTDYQTSNQDLPKGLLKIHSLIQTIRAHHENVIVIDNGDFLQGSPFCSYLATKLNSSQPLVDIYNNIHFDFAVLGNHEFNYGLDYLKKTIQAFNFPVLSANILQNNEPFTGHSVQYIEVANTKIAFIGLTTQYIPNWEKPENIQGLTFESAKKTAETLVEQTKQDADITVVCYHGGFEKDIHSGIETERLTGENEGYSILDGVRGIDVMITGHQHREIAETIQQTAVIQPGSKGDAIGKVTLLIDEDTNKIAKLNSDILFVDEHTEISDISSTFESVNQDVNAWLDQEITHLDQTMYVNDKFEARIKPHPLINLINYIQMEASDAQISSTALFDSAIGFGHTVTMRDIINNYPFPNTFYVLEITGDDLKQALEKAASYFSVENGELTVNSAFLEPKPQHFNYDMFAGVAYTLNINREIGNRASDIFVQGEALSFNKKYTIVLNNYRAVGGGDYHMFSTDKIIKEIQREGAELIIDYLQKHETSSIPTVLDFKVQP